MEGAVFDSTAEIAGPEGWLVEGKADVRCSRECTIEVRAAVGAFLDIRFPLMLSKAAPLVVEDGEHQHHGRAWVHISNPPAGGRGDKGGGQGLVWRNIEPPVVQEGSTRGLNFVAPA